MATVGFVNLSEALFNQTVLEPQASQAATQSNASTNIFSTTVVDEFTPSAQSTEQVSGLFTVNEISQFSPAAVAVLVPADSAALATASSATANALTAPVARTANSEAQLLQLNAALEDLGLSNAKISKIDDIAVLINNFHPATFTFLANQLKAQQSPPPTATAAPARTKTATA